MVLWRHANVHALRRQTRQTSRSKFVAAARQTYTSHTATRHRACRRVACLYCMQGICPACSINTLRRHATDTCHTAARHALQYKHVIAATRHTCYRAARHSTLPSFSAARHPCTLSLSRCNPFWRPAKQSSRSSLRAAHLARMCVFFVTF